MSRFALACFCAFAFGLAPAGAQTASPSPAPAAATAPSPEAVKIAAAMAKVTSFRIQLSSTNGMGGTITVLVPAKRTKAVVAMGPMMSETVSADGKMYARMNGADWRIMDVPPGGDFTAAALKSLNDPSKFRILPDRVENGRTLGVYEMTPPPPPGASATTQMPSLTCTYDKTTYLPRTCSFQTMTQTFEGWNDPANVVDVPVVASPAPAASPHP
ncbi:MAG: hypothetical protein M3169_17415 [Candidatus Eremiobacteraeota bacterium]|nr:hypothetical protein [Candidatus Eremiobacteraeota bacterium]